MYFVLWFRINIPFECFVIELKVYFGSMLSFVFCLCLLSFSSFSFFNFCDFCSFVINFGFIGIDVFCHIFGLFVCLFVCFFVDCFPFAPKQLTSGQWANSSLVLTFCFGCFFFLFVLQSYSLWVGCFIFC